MLKRKTASRRTGGVTRYKDRNIAARRIRIEHENEICEALDTSSDTSKMVD